MQIVLNIDDSAVKLLAKLIYSLAEKDKEKENEKEKYAKEKTKEIEIEKEKENTYKPENEVANRTYHKEAKPRNRQDVIDFVLENNIYMNGNEFYDYYEGHGWTNRNGEPFHDWRAVCRSWGDRERNADIRKELGNPQINTSDLMLLKNSNSYWKNLRPEDLPPVPHAAKERTNELGNTSETDIQEKQSADC